MSPSRSQALDHVVLVLFENRSLDNLLGYLYGPEDGKAFEGVIGKELSNPIPEWAEHGAEQLNLARSLVDTLDDDIAQAIETLEAKGPVSESERKRVRTNVTH